MPNKNGLTHDRRVLTGKNVHKVFLFADKFLPNTLHDYLHLKYLHSFRVPVSRVRLVLELRDVAESALRQQAQEEAPSLSHLPTKLCQ